MLLLSIYTTFGEKTWTELTNRSRYERFSFHSLFQLPYIYTSCTYISGFFLHAMTSITIIAHSCARNMYDTTNLVATTFIIKLTFFFSDEQ